MVWLMIDASLMTCVSITALIYHTAQLAESDRLYSNHGWPDMMKILSPEPATPCAKLKATVLMLHVIRR
jgi:hypothetical protein